MKYIAISREYGSGGHSIGGRVAERLGLEYYDKDIMRAVSADLGLDQDYVEKHGESSSVVEAIVRGLNPVTYDQKDTIFSTEVRVVADIIKKGPCIIIGRCADVILAGAGADTLNVFLYADEKHRIKRAGELLETTDVNVIVKQIRRMDDKRRSFYNRYSGKTWGDYRNYDLMLNTGSLGYEACVDMICRAAQEE